MHIFKNNCLELIAMYIGLLFGTKDLDRVVVAYTATLAGRRLGAGPVWQIAKVNHEREKEVNIH